MASLETKQRILPDVTGMIHVLLVRIAPGAVIAIVAAPVGFAGVAARVNTVKAVATKITVVVIVGVIQPNIAPILLSFIILQLYHQRVRFICLY